MSKSKTLSKFSDSETIFLDFRIYRDIQDQRHHMIIAPAEVLKNLRDCIVYSVCSIVQMGSLTILLHFHSCAFNEKQRGTIAISMKELEDSTGGCLKFRPKTDVDHGWIRINGDKGVKG